jgi:hypothetical protein
MTYKTKQEVTSNTYIEKWASNNLYVFTRGNFIVALTNQPIGKITQLIENIGLTGVYCNIFQQLDCVDATTTKIQITLQNGEVKIYVP